MRGPRASWIPAELTMEQPYSMCPVVHRVFGDCEVGLPNGTVQLTFPALGGCRTMDAPEAMTLSALWADAKVRRAARGRGVRLPLRAVKGMELVRLAGLRPEARRRVLAERAVRDAAGAVAGAVLAAEVL
jgi:hypothetical protein